MKNQIDGNRVAFANMKFIYGVHGLGFEAEAIGFTLG